MREYVCSGGSIRVGRREYGRRREFTFVQRTFVCGKENVCVRKNLWVLEGARVCGTDNVCLQESMCV